MSDTAEIAVIGAGVIGLAVAQRLASEGREVLLIDAAPPGSGASYGNAGTVADYAVQPVGTPSILRNLPSLLFDRDSPLAIRRAALLALAPWLLRFAWQSRPEAAQRNARALAALLADAGPRWRDLAAGIGGAGELQDRGCLYLYETLPQRRAAEADMAFRRSLGVTVEILNPEELRQLEPGLPAMEGGASFFPNARFMRDPGAMVGLLASDALARGVRLVGARANGIARRAGGVAIETTAGPFTARRAVIAAGAHSRVLARMAGDRVPLDTERGYHVEYDSVPARLSRPACPTARGFYFCPMAGRLRVAGTVELGGLSAPPSPHRVAKLDAGARALFPDLPAPSREWMGFRPSLPDSLPVIGASRGGAEVVLAFGHGHLGMTLAPITAEIVSGILAGRDPGAVARPVSPLRFG